MVLGVMCLSGLPASTLKMRLRRSVSMAVVPGLDMPNQASGAAQFSQPGKCNSAMRAVSVCAARDLQVIGAYLLCFLYGAVWPVGEKPT